MKKVFIATLLLVIPGICLADWGPDLGLSLAYMDHSGEATLFVMPDGSGSPFAEARTAYGQEVNATVTLELYNGNNDPINAYPYEDIWLESADGGLVACSLGTCADSNTDANGQTQWAEPLRAGGHSQDTCQVLINGASLYGPGLLLHFNSADISGDLIVNLTDVSLFATDFFGNYNFRSDFYRDSTLNLSDLSLLAQGMSASCP